MPIQEIEVPAQPKRVGDYRPRWAPRAKAPNVLLRLDWRTSINELGDRHYYAQINESLAVNVHRRGGKNTWEYLVIGFDLTKTDAPLILLMGTAGTKKEAQHLAEEKIPRHTPGTNTQVWPDEVPF